MFRQANWNVPPLICWWYRYSDMAISELPQTTNSPTCKVVAMVVVEVWLFPWHFSWKSHLLIPCHPAGLWFLGRARLNIVNKELCQSVSYRKGWKHESEGCSNSRTLHWGHPHPMTQWKAPTHTLSPKNLMEEKEIFSGFGFDINLVLILFLGNISLNAHTHT